MCLDVVYRGKREKEALSKLPEEFYVWKWLDFVSAVPCTSCSRDEVHAGEMKAPYLGDAYRLPPRYDKCSTYTERNKLSGPHAYKSGWHAYLRRNGVGVVNTRCLAKKKHIRAIGEQDGCVVVVLSHITFPKKCGKP